MSIQLQTHGGDIYAFEREILDFVGQADLTVICGYTYGIV